MLGWNVVKVWSKTLIREVRAKLKAWAQHRHPQKSGGWVSKKYWQTIGGDNWVFATRHEGKNPIRLRSHTETKIIRHVKVKGEASPYDGNLIYWSSRMAKHPEATMRESGNAPEVTARKVYSPRNVLPRGRCTGD